VFDNALPTSTPYVINKGSLKDEKDGVTKKNRTHREGVGEREGSAKARECQIERKCLLKQ
jgi:hypothetical protein